MRRGEQVGWEFTGRGSYERGKIFLGYAHQDEPKVRQILEALRDCGFPVFVDSDMPREWNGKKCSKLNLLCER